MLEKAEWIIIQVKRAQSACISDISAELGGASQEAERPRYGHGHVGGIGPMQGTVIRLGQCSSKPDRQEAS